VRTPSARYREFLRIDRWLYEFHQRAPMLFLVMCAGIAVSAVGLVFWVIDRAGR
jgi:hypothetical protein